MTRGLPNRGTRGAVNNAVVGRTLLFYSIIRVAIMLPSLGGIGHQSAHRVVLSFILKKTFGVSYSPPQVESLRER